MSAAPCCGPWVFDNSMVAARGVLSISVRQPRMVIPPAMRTIRLRLTAIACLLACKSSNEPSTPVSPRLRVVTGDEQVSAPRRVLPVPVVVQALSPSGQPEPFVLVTFAVASGGGFLQAPNQSSSVTVPSDGTGLASVQWSVGSSVGIYSNSLIAARLDVDAQVTFRATVLVGPPVALQFLSAPSLVAYNVVPNPEIRVGIVDGDGNLVSTATASVVTISTTPLVGIRGNSATTVDGVAAFPGFRITCSTVGTTSDIQFTATAGQFRGSTRMRVSGPPCP